MINSIASEISAYWQTLWVLLETPFNHSSLVWGIVPLYFGWIMNEFASDKRSFNTAMQSVVRHGLPMRTVRYLAQCVVLKHKAAVATATVTSAVLEVVVGRHVGPVGRQREQGI